MATDMKNLAHAQGDTPEELENLKAWWNEHGNLVTIVLLVVLVAVVGVKQFSAWRERRQASAMSELRQATDPEALEALVRTAPRSVVPLARLQLGVYYYGRHNYDLALDAYRGIVEDSPDHALAGPLAAVGVAQCEEALGHVEKAAELFAAFAAANTNSYLAPLATIGQARCLVLQGTEESRAKGKQILDLFLTESPGTAWAAQADEVIRARNRLSVPAAPAAVDVETLLAGSGDAAPEAAAAAVADALADPGAPAPEAAAPAPQAGPVAAETPAATEPAPAATAAAAAPPPPAPAPEAGTVAAETPAATEPAPEAPAAEAAPAPEAPAAEAAPAAAPEAPAAEPAPEAPAEEPAA